MKNLKPWLALIMGITLMAFSNCAPGKPMKAEYIEPSLDEKIRRVLTSDKFVVEYISLGAGELNSVYTAAFNRRMGILMVENAAYNGATVTKRCSVVWSGTEIDDLEAALNGVSLGVEGQTAKKAGDSWLTFLDNKGNSFRVFFEGSSGAGMGKKVISMGQALKDAFVRRGTCPS